MRARSVWHCLFVLLVLLLLCLSFTLSAPTGKPKQDNNNNHNNIDNTQRARPASTQQSNTQSHPPTDKAAKPTKPHTQTQSTPITNKNNVADDDDFDDDDDDDDDLDNDNDSLDGGKAVNLLDLLSGIQVEVPGHGFVKFDTLVQGQVDMLDGEDDDDNDDDDDSGDYGVSSAADLPFIEQPPKPKHDLVQQAKQFRKFRFNMDDPDEYDQEAVLLNSNADFARARALLEEAAAAGNDDAMQIIGEMYEFGEQGGVSNFGEALQWYLKAAALGNPHAQFALGFMYSTGKGVPIDEGLAVLYFSFASNGGSLEANLALGFRFMHGHGVPKDCARAALSYELVAAAAVEDLEASGFATHPDNTRLNDEYEVAGAHGTDEDIAQYFQYTGDTNALVQAGTLHLHGGMGLDRDYDQALDYFRRAAEQGNPAAMSNLGFMYQNGYGVERDNATAVEYFRKAAEKGNLHAQTSLGVLYLQGWGVEQSYAEAYKLFKLAADKGYADAQMHLGQMFYYAWHVKKDYSKAFALFSVAASQGNIPAIFKLAQMQRLGHGGPANCLAAVSLFKRVAERGDWIDILADAHDLFDDGDQDSALLFYERAAIMGYEIGQSNAAWMYTRRMGTTLGTRVASGNFDEGEEADSSDLQLTRWIPSEKFLDMQAFRYYSLAAEQSNAEAYLKLGDCHYYGKGTEIDLNRAGESYTHAQLFHSAQAMFNLGYMHQYGKGKPKDLFLAKRYYDMALSSNPEAYLPVGLALIGLAGHFAYDYLRGEIDFPFSWSGGETSSTEPGLTDMVEWDTVVILVLTLALAVAVAIRQRALMR